MNISTDMKEERESVNIGAKKTVKSNIKVRISACVRMSGYQKHSNINYVEQNAHEGSWGWKFQVRLGLR